MRSAAKLLVGGLMAVASLVMAPVPAAMACSCAALPLGDPVEIAGRTNPHYDRAFIGVVTKAHDGLGDARIEMEVTDWLHPDIQPEPASVVLVQRSIPAGGQLGADCSFGFVKDDHYLVEAHVRADKLLETNGCTLTTAYGQLDHSAGVPEPASDVAPKATGESDGGIGWIVAGVLLLIAVVLVVVSARGESHDH